MFIKSSREMLRGLDVSHVTLYEWIKQGMPVIKQNPYMFNKKALEWVAINKPKYKINAEKMLEGGNERANQN